MQLIMPRTRPITHSSSPSATHYGRRPSWNLFSNRWCRNISAPTEWRNIPSARGTHFARHAKVSPDYECLINQARAGWPLWLFWCANAEIMTKSKQNIVRPAWWWPWRQIRRTGDQNAKFSHLHWKTISHRTVTRVCVCAGENSLAPDSWVHGAVSRYLRGRVPTQPWK